mgnify:CR=1 FL=1
MRQQINLYQHERHQAPKLAEANLLLITLALSVTLIAAYYAFSLWERNHAQNRLSMFEEQSTELTAQRDEMSEQVKQLQPSVALETQLDNLNSDLEAKRIVLNLLRGDEAGNRTGFSSHLEGLARRPLKGLWLTGISITGGGQELDLRGKALQAELVPVYLEKLRDESAFSGHEFRLLEMTRPPKAANSIEFQLRTLTDEGHAGG